MEKKDYLNPNWLKHQYYELKRSIQDIANDQHVPMPTIWSRLEKLEKPISIKEELKTEELNHVPSIPMENEGKPLKKCPHCGYRLSLSANFCATCGEKIEGTQLELPLQEMEEEVPETEVPQITVERVKPVPLIPEEVEESSMEEVPKIKIEETKTIPPIKDKEVETIQTTPLISDKKEKKIKKIPSTCKFCGMVLNPEASFCPQCGTILKKK
jgi:predicted Zn-ribbon and HTH transcriptional regulator